VTARGMRRRLVLADGGIIDLIAVKIAACGPRQGALTSAERQLADARILAQGGTPYLISKPLHVRDGEAGALRVTHSLRCRQLHVPASTGASPARNWPTPSEEKRRTQP
jgi:hypothetical protein